MVGLFFFCSIFVVAGLAVAYVSTVRPLLRSRAALEWSEASCLVESASIRRVESDDDVKYAPEIRFSFAAMGRRFHGSHISFYSESRSDRSEVEERLQSYAVGTIHPCYYDPELPEEAVIDRAWRPKSSIMGLFGLGFALAGVAAFLHSLHRDRSVLDPWRHIALPDGRFELQARDHNAAEMFIALAFALIFDVSLLLIAEAIPSKGAMGVVFFVIWLLPCALLTGWFGRLLLLRIGPKLRVVVYATEFRAGETIAVDWSLRGLTPIRELTISLEGIEEATYTRGTDRITDTEEFHHQTVRELVGHARAVSGTDQVKLPKSAMPSFVAENNQIRWTLRFAADVAYWPDIDAELDIRVRGRRG
jgi:hypothetical protein